MIDRSKILLPFQKPAKRLLFFFAKLNDRKFIHTYGSCDIILPLCSSGLLKQSTIFWRFFKRNVKYPDQKLITGENAYRRYVVQSEEWMTITA